MIVVMTGDHVGADALSRELAGDRGCQADRLEARVDLQADATKGSFVAEAFLLGALPGEDQGKPLRFRERGQRAGVCQGAIVRVFHAAEDIGLRQGFGLKVAY